MKHTTSDYRRCADAGMTIRQAADALGVSHQAIANAVTRHGIEFAPAYPDGVSHDRKLTFSASPDVIRRYLERAKS